MICWRSMFYITGCDTVATYHGIGKLVALKVLRTGKLSLFNVGDITVSVEEVPVQATNVMLSCYGRPECTSLTDARQKIWSWKVSQRIGAAPSFKNFPLQMKLVQKMSSGHTCKWQHGNMPYISTYLIWILWPMWEDKMWRFQLHISGSYYCSWPCVFFFCYSYKCSCISAIPCKSKRCGFYNTSIGLDFLLCMSRRWWILQPENKRTDPSWGWNRWCEQWW